jgi:prolyl-tRNA synthetase
MRAREFMMKDAYSFHASQESLQETYDAMAGAYRRILERCGLEGVQVQAESGAIGGDINHEFIVLADAGESVMFRCPACGYAANDERAVSAGAVLLEMEPSAKMEKIATPGKHTVEDVSAFFQVSPQRLVKTLLYKSKGRDIAALVPGDRELNEIKLAKVLDDAEARPMAPDEVEAVTGAPVGFAGPVGLKATIVADELLSAYDGMIVGANAPDAHLRGVKLGRDFSAAQTARISMAIAGDRCSTCGKGELKRQRGVEIGHIFKLDTKYSSAMKATFLDAEGKERPFIMGCYGFGVSRAVAAAIEQQYDEKGIRWPKALTPFHVVVTPLNLSDDTTAKTMEQVYTVLTVAGYDVLLDDRDLRPGAKFKDAELIGVPVRVTLGERNLKDGNCEIYYRLDDRTDIVSVKDVVATVRRYYETPTA